MLPSIPGSEQISGVTRRPSGVHDCDDGSVSEGGTVVNWVSDRGREGSESDSGATFWLVPVSFSGVWDRESDCGSTD